MNSDPINNNLTGDHTAGSGVQVIARAAQIMRALHRHPDGLTRTQLATEVNLARSTVHRIVGALIEERWIDAVSPDGLLHLGGGLLPLAMAVKSDLRRELRPYLEQLHREVAETVDLACFVDNQVRFIDQIAGPHRLQAVSAIGVTFPLHCTANGKAFLAALSPADIKHVLPKKLIALTGNTITSRAQLLDEVTEIQCKAIAYDREEHTAGICAVGAALRTSLNELIAISIPVPSQRFYSNEERFVTKLKSTMQDVRAHFSLA